LTDMRQADRATETGRRSRTRGSATATPAFEINRSWSNPSLSDPQTIIALVLERPTTHDVAQAILSYGLDAVSDVKTQVEAELPPFRRDYLARIWNPVLTGLSRAALRRPA
jgi:hypothetical protein